MTPLHIAAKKGPLEIVRCLTDVAGAAINTQDNNGVNMLIFLSNSGVVSQSRSKIVKNCSLFLFHILQA